MTWPTWRPRSHSGAGGRNGDRCLAGLFQAGLDIRPIVTHTFPLAQFARGFELMRDGRCGKVVLVP